LVFSRVLICGLLLICSGAGPAADPSLMDPMRPYTPPPVGERAQVSSGWRLTTIVRAGENHVAILNGKAVRVGDRIDAARVTAIDPWQVHLRQGDKNIVIQLHPSKVHTNIVQREAKP
jgi:MSHA biogenesis protein MshK